MSSDLLELARQPKIFDVVIFDWFVTFLVGYYIALLLHEKMGVKMEKSKFIIITIVVLIIIGIYAHIVFNVATMLGYYLGLSDKPAR